MKNRDIKITDNRSSHCTYYKRCVNVLNFQWRNLPRKMSGRFKFAHHYQQQQQRHSSWIRRLIFNCCVGGNSYSRRGYIIFLWLVIFCYIFGAFYAYTFICFNTGRSSHNNGLSPSEDSRKFDNYLDTHENFDFKVNEETKKILFWTKFYLEEGLDNYCIRTDVLRTSCPYSKCEFTTDTSQLLNADAVIFHGRDLRGPHMLNGHSGYIELPKFRSELQSWIFLMFEAPVHTWIDLKPFDNLFNMTMTYRPDSDIHIPYGRIFPIQSQSQDFTNGRIRQALPIINSTKKNRLVAWSVSNCYQTPSRRNEVVHELHKYIEIDIFGACGSRNCTPYTSLCDSGLECHKWLADKYKFYLAFENSLCESYITEKFYDSLYVGMVPVVYGYGDYSRVAPKGSYIDATVFPNMKSLADYLLYLDRNPREYEKYFEWRKSFTASVSYFDEAWCSLCTELWTSHIPNNFNNNDSTTSLTSTQVRQSIDVKRRKVKNLTDWWFHKSKPFNETETDPGNPNSNPNPRYERESACINPNDLKWDTSMFTFYGFIYYPNYTVKMGVMYTLSIIALLLLIFSLIIFIRNRIYLKQ